LLAGWSGKRMNSEIAALKLEPDKINPYKSFSKGVHNKKYGKG